MHRRTIYIRVVCGSVLLTALGLEPVQLLKEARSPVQVNFFSSEDVSNAAQSPQGSLQNLGPGGERKVVTGPGLNFAGHSIFEKSPGVWRCDFCSRLRYCLSV